jgi:hypothetical protein
MKQYPRNRREENRLVSFARSYLAESFPNPDRVGCPAEGALRRLAESPASADLSITEHLGSCSPCFRQYQKILGEMRSNRLPRAILWNRLSSAPIAVILGVLCIAVIGLSIALWSNRKDIARAHMQHTEVADGNGLTRYIPFALDLRDAGTVRGENETLRSPIKLPSMPLHIAVYLPVGSESGEYAISLEANGKPVWSGSGAAQLRDHKMVLEFERDLTSYPLGEYTLVISSTTGLHLKQKVVLDPAMRH